MQNGLVNQNTKFKKRVASDDVSDYKVVRHGQLVVGFPIDEGVLDFQLIYEAGIVSPAYGVWDLTAPTRVDCNYLNRFLRSPQAISYYRTKLRGSTARRRSLPNDVFLALPVPIPSVEEQRGIVAMLDQTDALRAKRRQVFAHLDTLIHSIFHDMFGDPIANERGLPVRPLVAWVAPDRPITYGILKPGPDVPNGVPYVRVADMKERGIDIRGIRRTTAMIAAGYRRSMLRGGDLLMSIRGHVGRFAFVPDNLAGANITQDSARLAIHDPESAIYLRAAMESSSCQHWMARRTKGAAVKGINLGDLRELPLPVPGAEEVTRFSTVARNVERQRETVRAESSIIEGFFASLQSRAFKGEL